MLIKFTEEQSMIRDMVKEFTEKEVAPRDKWMDENGFDWSVYNKLCETGLVGVHFPEEYGGAGCDAVTSTIVIHELAKGSASIALALDISWVASDMILHNGTPEQKAKYLPLAAEGKIFAFGLTEASAGSDAARIQTTAVKADDGSWVLNGGKSWITNSGVADYYIIMAITDRSKGAKGISAFIMPKETDGLIIGKHEDKMGMRGTSTCELSFDNMRLPADALLSTEGMGFKIAMQTLDGGRIGIAAQALGICEGAMDEAKEYTATRIQFGKPLNKFQNTQFVFADMALAIETGQLLTYRAAQLRSEGRPYGKEAAMAKLHCSESAMWITTKALQMFGGYGYTKDYPIERMMRDAKITEIYEGTSEVQRIVISGYVLGK